MKIALEKLLARTGWLPAVGWALLIFWLSSQSEPVDPDMWLPPHTDKVIHMILFGGLAWMIYPFMRINGCSGFVAACLSMSLASLYGIFDEFHQSTVPNRHMDINDWIADSVGAATVFWLRARESRIVDILSRRRTKP